MHAECIERVVPARHALEEDRTPEATDAADEAHHECGDGTDEARGGRDDHEAADGARNQAQKRGTAAKHPFDEHPGDARSGGCDLRDEDRHDGALVGGKAGAAVEAKPADPEDGGAEHRKGEVVRTHGLAAVAEALAQHETGDEARDARVDVHDRAARIVKRAHVEEESAFGPNPVAHG